MINDVQQLTRHIMGNVPTWMAVSFYAAAILAFTWTSWTLFRRILHYRKGRPLGTARITSSSAIDWKENFLALLSRTRFHHKMARDPFAGAAHMLVFYGFVILFIGTCMVFLEHDTPLHFFYGRFYQIASLIIDLGGLAFLVGLSMFLWRRLFGASSRILKRYYVAALAWLLLAIGVSGFLLEGARIAVDRPAFEQWSVVGYSVAYGMNLMGVEGEAALSLHQGLWGFHALLCIVFFSLLPWKFFAHMIFGPVSWILRSQEPRAALRTVELSPASSDLRTPGASSWQDLAWIDLMQADACTTCGRCNAECPAHASGKPLRPRDIVLGVRQAMDDQAGHDAPNNGSLAAYIAEDALWSCTTCGACNEACPVGIDVYGKIVSMRQGHVEAGNVPAAASARFDSTADHFNPYQKPNSSRMDWAAGLNVPVAAPGEQIELLYWIGCAGSFDPEGRSVSRAMIKILNSLGLSYAVLGKRESCTGDPVRRMGEEGLFQELAEHNMRRMEEHGVVHVLTHCPHCFNTFRNEYPQLHDVKFTVEHHSEFLQRMIDEGKLQAAIDVSKTVTFHDPCYLGRGNAQTTTPRATLDAVDGLKRVEMPRHGTNSFCCGAGGGSMWLDIAGDERIENQRAAEAASTGAEAVVTGCPFCKVMLQAGRQSLDDNDLQVVDLAELIVQAEGL